MTLELLHSLPVVECLGKLKKALAAKRNAVLVAPPGAGKTTAVPIALLKEDWCAGKILVIEPRRIAARAPASFLALGLGEEIGKTIGYRVRFDSKSGPNTRIEYVTGGVFTRMILDDPELTGISAVVFDEFHERSAESDLGMALALDAQTALRRDLRILAMSATLQGEAVSNLLGNAPIIESKGRSFLVEIRYAPPSPQERIADSTARAIRTTVADHTGSVLVFLPGQREIRQTMQLLEDRLPAGCELHQLYGALDTKAQDEAIQPAHEGKRKIVLASPIAETSLTIDGVNIVIDSGLKRAPRFEPRTGLTRLETMRASLSSVDQRAGRAGRTAPGVAIRLWHEGQNAALPAHDRPEILEADLSSLVLDLAEWGVRDPAKLNWIDPPPRIAWNEAVTGLRTLGALDDQARLSATGKRIRSLPVEPSLAAMILRAGEHGVAETAAILALLLSEPGAGGRFVDISQRLDRIRNEKSGRGVQIRRQAKAIARSVPAGRKEPLQSGLLLSLAFPDRIAKARDGKGRFLLANGRGANLEESEPLARMPWLVVADVQGKAAAARIVSAVEISQAEIEFLHRDRIEHFRQLVYDEDAGRFRVTEERKLGAILLSRANHAPGPKDDISRALLELIHERGLDLLQWNTEAAQLRMRLDFLYQQQPDIWPDVSETALLGQLEEWLLPFLMQAKGPADISGRSLFNGLGHLLTLQDLTLRQVEELAPATFHTAAGSNIAIRYSPNDAILAVRVQELYGLNRHPAILAGQYPLTLELLSPAGRPIQVTRDLPGFWSGTWSEVAREMRGRYPKHVWPDDPAKASPTRRAKPRKS